MLKPILFFDTQIPIDVAFGRIAPRDWRTVRSYVSTHFRYRISPLTLTELLVGIARGDEAHFLRNRTAVRELCWTSLRPDKFLRPPDQFVLKTVFGEDNSKLGLEPANLCRSVEVLLRARNLKQLNSGDVLLRSPRRSFGLDLHSYEQEFSNGQRVHVDQLNELRAGHLHQASKLSWAAGLLKRLGRTPTHTECCKVAGSLDAAYQFDSWLCHLALTSDYDFSKHDSDWIDAQQLYYLSCDDTYFVTRDQRLIKGASTSAQGNRVLSYDALRERIERTREP